MSNTIRAYSNDEHLILERRSQITKYAIKLFLDKGFQNTTTRLLSKASKIPEGTIYRYIGSKNDLLHLICIEKSDAGEYLEKLIEKNNELSVSQLLKMCIEVYLTAEDADRDYIVFFNREIKNFSPDDRRLLLKDEMAITEAFEKLLLKGISTGEFKITNPKLIAHNITMLGQIWPLHHWYLKRDYSLNQYIEEQTQLILKQIKNT